MTRAVLGAGVVSAAKQYVRNLWNGLNGIQRDYRERGYSADFELYDIKDWTRESVATYVEARLGDILVDMEPAAPVDIYRALHLGAEIARKQNAAGDLPFMIETGPEAVTYAADRLKSKIERNCVYNPVTEAHAALLDYRFLKEMSGGKNVVYLDRYRQQSKPEAVVAVAEAPEQPECEPEMIQSLPSGSRQYVSNHLTTDSLETPVPAPPRMPSRARIGRGRMRPGHERSFGV